MVITATTLEELAGQLVRLVVTTWARAVNNRPPRRAARGAGAR